MSHGLLCIGAGGQTIIDSDHSVFHVMASGSYAANNSVAWVNYPSAIQTAMPPVVFISPDGPANYLYFNHLGSPGNWTGFTVQVLHEPRIMNGYSPSGRYCACGLNPPKTLGYGLQVFNGVGATVFDSNYSLMNFIGGFQAWSPTYSIDLTWFQRAWIYQAAWAWGASRYFVVSTFGDDTINNGFAGFISIGFRDHSKSVIQVCAVSARNGPAPTIKIPLLVPSRNPHKGNNPMARQEIILGTPPTGLGGDPPRVASQKINHMTQELYTQVSELGTASVKTAQTDPKAQNGELLVAGLNGIGLMRDLRGSLYATGSPSDLMGSGTTIGFADGAFLGIPGLSPSSYGVLHTDMHYADMSGFAGQQQRFKSTHGDYMRVPATLESWGNWFKCGSRIVGTLTDDGTDTAQGAIIERGENANGEFTKFADGTLLARTQPITSKVIGRDLYDVVGFTLPTTVFNNGYTAVSAVAIPTQDNNQYGVIACYMNDSTTGGVIVRNGPNTAQAFSIRVGIIGRWK